MLVQKNFRKAPQQWLIEFHWVDLFAPRLRD
jgi:hypothetical protein